MKENVIQQCQRWYHKFQISQSPQFNLVLGFFIYVVSGIALLSLPWFHNVPVPFIDNFFTATSAVSTTGLVTVNLYKTYNFGGQLIIMFLFQLGGIGYMTLTTYYLLFTTNRITKWHSKIIGTEFSLPKTIKVRDFIRSVIVFTLVMEALGAISFTISFINHDMPFSKALWFGIFHSISAFCTAGFGLFSNSFVDFQNDPMINLTIGLLAIGGSLGFIVITDLWYKLKGKSEQISFTSKVIIYSFMLLLTLGTLLIYFTEPLVVNTSGNKLFQAFFQTMTAMTTVGFNTISTAELALPTMIFVIFLMYVGASPAGTAGGMKITTLTAMIAILKSRLIGQKQVTFLHRIIPVNRLYVATSTFIFYTSLIFIFTFIIAYTEDATFDKILFEVASALGTVGLSAGLTGELSAISKILMIILMFIGRVGVLTFGFALLKREQNPTDELTKEDLVV